VNNITFEFGSSFAGGVSKIPAQAREKRKRLYLSRKLYIKIISGSVPYTAD
jgi:hypothetical protein